MIYDSANDQTTMASTPSISILLTHPRLDDEIAIGLAAVFHESISTRGNVLAQSGDAGQLPTLLDGSPDNRLSWALLRNGAAKKCEGQGQMRGPGPWPKHS
jgi:hypothetical protein